MNIFNLRKMAVVVLGMAVLTGTAFAHGDRHDRGREIRHERMERRMEHRRWERSRTREHWRNQRSRWEAEHRRDDHRPAGWDHGRKEGWHGGSLPPGQARKDGGSPFHRDDHNAQNHGFSGYRPSGPTNANTGFHPSGSTNASAPASSGNNSKWAAAMERMKK